MLAQRSDEIAAVNARWKKQTEKLEAELETLRKENIQLKAHFSSPQKESEKDV